MTETPSTEPTAEELVEEVIRNTTFAADAAWFRSEGQLGAARVRAVVEAVVRSSIGNRMMQVRPVAEWAEWMALDPPYEPGWPDAPSPVEG